MTTGAICAILLAAVFAAVGAVKAFALPPARREAARLGIGVLPYRAIGALEIAAAGGLIAGPWWPALAVGACAGLVCLMIGAVAVLRRAGTPLPRAVPAAGLGVFAAITAALLLSG